MRAIRGVEFRAAMQMGKVPSRSFGRSNRYLSRLVPEPAAVEGLSTDKAQLLSGSEVGGTTLSAEQTPRYSPSGM